MDNEPKRNNFSKYIIIIIAVLLAIVLALIAVIIYNRMQPGNSEPAETQMSVTDAPTFSPVPTIEPVPVVTVPVTVEPTPSPEITPIVIDEGDVVWVNLSYLNVREYPDFAYDRIISIPYGTRVTGTIDGLWMLTSYNGTEGYIYVGEVKDSDKPCVVHSQGDLWPPE